MKDLGNIFGMFQNFQKFASTFNGNPEQIAKQMMESGRFSPEQIEAAKEKATQIESILNGFGKGR